MRAIPSFSVLSILLTAAPVFAAQEISPTAFPPSRYEKMLEASPFALATPPAPTEAPKDSFAKDWVVTGISRQRGNDGVERDFVSIMTRDQTQRFYLFGKEENAEGVSIVSVERSPHTGKSKVTVKKGGEVGVVGFDEMQMQNSSGPATPAGAPGRPGVPGAAPRLTPTVPALNPVRQQVGGRPVIPRPNLPLPGAPNGAQMNNGAAPFPAQSAEGGRRRIRVINSKP